jgi:hypothetical protein
LTDAFSDYVVLLDEIGQIPAAARASPNLSTEQRAATVAQVVELVRNRVLPQSDREEACLETLLGDELTALAHARRVPETTDHDAILAPVAELTHADPQDGARIQTLLYRIHAAIAGHFGEAELILAPAQLEEPAPRHGASPGSSDLHASERGHRYHPGPSAWFG